MPTVESYVEVDAISRMADEVAEQHRALTQLVAEQIAMRERDLPRLRALAELIRSFDQEARPVLREATGG